MHGPDKMFLTLYVGEAKEKNGSEYTLLSIGAHNPAIKSKQTGKLWVLSWKEILSLAIDQGVNT